MIFNSDGFTIREWINNKGENIKILQSKNLLKYDFKHGFFFKNSCNYGPSNLIEAIDKEASIHSLNQVHGDRVVPANKSLNELSKGDCLISNGQKQSLWVYTADCIPILFADKEKGITACCHSGWRGIANGIIIKTIMELKKRGCSSDKLLVALGPAISGENYQVDSKVANSIIKSVNSINTSSVIINDESNRQVYNFLISKDGGETFNLDIRIAAVSQLLSQKLPKENISLNSICTFSEKTLFNSWRRDKRKAHQWSTIVSKMV